MFYPKQEITTLMSILVGARLSSAFTLYRNRPLATSTKLLNWGKPTRIFASTATASARANSSGDMKSSSTDDEYSTLTLLEHVNLNIPDHAYALPFYGDLLGFGLDPRRAANVEKGSGTVWMNCGASQFHLPFGEEAQTIPGSIGLIYSSLEPLKNRLKEELAKEANADERCFLESEVGVDERTGQEYVKLVDRYNNTFFARKNLDGISPPGKDQGLKQPLVTKSDNDEFGEVASKYGMDESECVGISYVEFLVPPKTASSIAEFYESVLDATVSVVQIEEGIEIAIVAFGKIDENGRSDQTVLFREKEGFEVPPYDGHHISMYVGVDAKDFEASFKNCNTAGVIWVNPRFSDKAVNLNNAKIYKQYRFKNILNIRNGKKIFELEHEIRSVNHQSYPGSN